MKQAIVIGRAQAMPRRGTPGLPLVMLGVALLLPGCAGGGGWPFGRGGATTAAPATAAEPSDPVLAFAARSQPGTQERITLANGQPATVRLVRAYHAASGRECREVALGTGLGERSRLLCATPEGGWSESRTLLRGGGIPRP
jgi:hypothetical protein